MKIELADINTIKPYPNNPRKLSDIAIEKVSKSIKEFGFRQPIVVDKDRIIVVGHTRYRASKKLGYKQVPITIAENLTKEQINAYRIADNRTNEEAKWDDELLKMELKELEYKDFDLKMTGFDDKQINDLLFEEKQGLTDDDAVPDTPEEPITKLGDIWQLGKHRLLCGDSTKEEDVNKLMDGQKADMVFTDPPYDLVNDSWLDICIDKNKEAEHIIFASDKQTLRYCNTYKDMFKNFYIIYYKQFNWNLSKYTPILTHTVVSHLRNTNKKHIDLKGLHSLLEFPSIRDYTIMTHSKRLECILPFINVFSTKLILDVFLGSGSTLIACEKLDRICYGMELDPKYCDVIVKRWEQWTGEKATK